MNGARLAFTTDSYVVKPIFFPGGDIGELAVNGTVNDLAVSGARPLALSAGFVIEEGFPVADLRADRRLDGPCGAERAGVPVAAGDTKVVERGKADGLYVTTAGVGVVAPGVDARRRHRVRPGDRVLVSGTIGDHGMAVMVARGELQLEVDVQSDTASRARARSGAARHWATACAGCATRPAAALATTLNELARAGGRRRRLEETALPVRPEVVGACEILGIDPLYVANEGRLVAVVAPEACDAALAALRSHPLGAEAAIVGEVRAEPEGLVLLDTGLRRQPDRRHARRRSAPAHLLTGD